MEKTTRATYYIRDKNGVTQSGFWGAKNILVHPNLIEVRYEVDNRKQYLLIPIANIVGEILVEEE